MENLEEKYEEVKSLKSRYSITTHDAWEYVKSKEKYKILQRQIIANPEKETPYIPSLRELSHLCKDINIIAISAVKKTYLEKKKDFLADFESNIQEFANCKIILEDRVLEQINKEIFGQREKRVDYFRFAKEYYKIRKSLPPQKALRGITLKLIENEFPFFIHENKALTLSEIAKDKELYGFVKPTNSTKEETKCLGKLDIKLLDKFNKWLRGKYDLPLSVENSKGFTSEERELLYKSPSDLYERAERERILRTIETERRVALGEFINHEFVCNLSEKDKNTASTEASINKKIENNKKLLFEREKRLKSLRDINAPSPVLKSAIKLVENVRYVMLALKKNKEWLKDTLDEISKNQ